VFSFPTKAPDGALVRDDLDAISHLWLCLEYQRHWCEHKPSVTISVKEDEWASVGEWVHQHFDELAGVSFLPYDTGSYKQTPYEAISEARFDELQAAMPPQLNWEAFQEVERGERDHLVGRDHACAQGDCDVVGETVERMR
jgi:ribonucleoside-triphosphate reductase (thioredoxin)